MTLVGTPNYYSEEWPLEIYRWHARYYFLEIHFKEWRKLWTFQTLIFQWYYTRYLQDRYAFPAVNNIYNAPKESIILRAREEENFICLGTEAAITQDILQSMEQSMGHVARAGNSAKLELAGLKSLLTSLEPRNVTISSLTTERHRQVRAYLKKEKPNINHQFGLWHIGENMRPTTLLKKRPWHRCFPVSFVKFLRTSFLTEHLQWLLLKVSPSVSIAYHFPHWYQDVFPNYWAFLLLFFIHWCIRTGWQ